MYMATPVAYGCGLLIILTLHFDILYKTLIAFKELYEPRIIVNLRMDSFINFFFLFGDRRQGLAV